MAARLKRILIVDDEEPNRELLVAMVESLGYEADVARDGVEALAKLHLDVDLILLDVMMAGMDGFQVAQRIRRDPQGGDVPIIMVTGLTSREDRLLAVEAGANDFISKPFERIELRVRMASLLRMKEAQDALRLQQRELELLVERRTASLRDALQAMVEAQRQAHQAQLDTVERLAIAAEFKDKTTAYHIHRMSHFAAIIARGLRLPPGEVEDILHASRMHDVGKLGIPDDILRKPADLDDPERDVMRQHTTIGGRILGNTSSRLLQEGQIIAMSHHEWWDGSGYPNGLSGEAIPLSGRICAVADVFDAVTSVRPYKPAFSNEEACEILRRERGTHFDPRIVDVFFEHLKEVVEVQARYRDGVVASYS
ncbi:MAG TPA: HD domain-containing phosphohydrolase [Vicinamibacterales bacterium]|nr:HD domain-containing phosphohydrolase [Vicinamibacterales bacterium]